MSFSKPWWNIFQLRGQHGIQERMKSMLPEYTDVFSIQHFEKLEENKFLADYFALQIYWSQGVKYAGSL